MEIQPDKIYQNISEEINAVINALSKQAAENQDEIGRDISSAINNLCSLNQEIQENLNELQRLSEWDKFTIAFYGETNAGKSTLIEALRLLLNEPSKCESQKKFKELALKSGLTEEAFIQIRQRIMNCEQALGEVRKNLNDLQSKYAETILRAEVEVDHLTKLLKEIESKQNWWEKLVSWFSPPQEKQMLRKAQNDLSEVKEAQRKETEGLEQQLKDLSIEQQNAEIENKRLMKEAETLKQFADGQIIGDGRSDFTRNNTSFEFNSNNQEFVLIDVPGIEGNEEIVRTPIEEAVKKAHAVFYVTRTPRPPQTHEGEDGNQRRGTLEKMKEHLGSQTEVWTIYNHAVNNPRSLKSPLIGSDEQAGLSALDEKLREELQEKYCSSLVVSARPAYLGLTECIVPGSKEESEKRKFLERFGSKEKILELSGLTDFVEKLSSEIISDYRGKIKRSNLNKAYQALNGSLEGLRKVNEEFNQKKKEISQEIHSAKSRIKVLQEQLSGDLDTTGRKVLRTFESNVRNKIYDLIENDISNDTFKFYLREEMEKQGNNLENELRDAIKVNIDDFGETLSKLVERSNQHLNAIANSRKDTMGLDKFDMNINIDNGVNLLGLVSSGVGVVLSVLAPVALPLVVLSVMGALISVGKAVWGFFSSSYKMSQQRKEADKAIRNAVDTIEGEVNKILTSMKQATNEQVEKVLAEISAPITQYNAIILTLKKAETGLNEIAQNIQQ